MEQLRKLRHAELSKVAEFIDRSRFVQKTLEKKWSSDKLHHFKFQLENSKIQKAEIKDTLNAGLMTYLLHW
jgi:hypothetical protein